MKKARMWLIGFALFLLSALATYGIFITLENKEIPQTEPVEEEVVYFSESGDDSRLNFLLLGYGGAGHDGGYLSDVVMLVSVDKLNKQVTLVSIPRDLWVSVPIQSDKSQNFKINAAYAIGHDDRGYPLKEPLYKGEYGAGNLAMKVVGDTLGLEIQNFAAVDFGSFEDIVDLLGGVEVDVAQTFDDYFYPLKGLENETCGFSAQEIAEFHQKYSGFNLEKQFTCRYEHLHFEKGKAKMDGKTALKFVRSRHSDNYGGDFARGERQNAVLFAAKDKLLSLYAAKNLDDIFEEFDNMLHSDLNLSTLKALLNHVGNPKEYKIKHIGLTVDNVLIASKSNNGQFILVPKEGVGKWEGVRQFVENQFNSN